jgi:alginate O-acetyltransferase complex protein AlgI
MVFSSYIFIFYLLPLSLLLYYPIPYQPLRHLSLTLVSYVFYGWSNPPFVALMVLTTAGDYLAALTQAHNGFRGWRGPAPLLEENGPRSKIQRAAFLFSLGANLGMLAFFKYFNFGVDSYNASVAALGIPQAQWNDAMRIALPLGISFYTFQSMSYAIDVYRGQTRAMKNLNDYFCFVTQYQQLVAGPIVRFSELADQFSERTHTLDKFARGVALFCVGLALKVLLANPCGKVADTIFNAGPSGPLEAWYGACAYAFQIFFDFAGYSEMAIGLGLLMGFVFAKNFESPYQADSITDFWRRWHISLSSWLRDYLYISLGGNRKGETRTYFNLLITMLLGGLWHGASWNFLIWGGLHGVALAAERRLGKTSLYAALPRAVRVALTFVFVVLAWVFFRSPDLPTALAFLGSMFCVQPAQSGAGLVAGVVYQPYYIASFALAGLVAWTFPTPWAWTQHITIAKAVGILLLFWVSLLFLITQAYNPFIYFIF